MAVHQSVLVYVLSDHGWAPRGCVAAPVPVLDMQCGGAVVVMTQSAAHVLDTAHLQLGPSVLKDPVATPLCILAAAGRVFVAEQCDGGSRVTDQFAFNVHVRHGRVRVLAMHDTTLLGASTAGIVCWDLRTGAQTQHMRHGCVHYLPGDAK